MRLPAAFLSLIAIVGRVAASHTPDPSFLFILGESSTSLEYLSSGSIAFVACQEKYYDVNSAPWLCSAACGRVRIRFTVSEAGV